MTLPDRLNAEELAPYKVTVDLALLYRWAHALAGASGTIQGLSGAFKAKGLAIAELDAEEAHLDEIRAEMNLKMKEGMGL